VSKNIFIIVPPFSRVSKAFSPFLKDFTVKEGFSGKGDFRAKIEQHEAEDFIY